MYPTAEEYHILTPLCTLSAILLLARRKTRNRCIYMYIYIYVLCIYIYVKNHRIYIYVYTKLPNCRRVPHSNSTSHPLCHYQSHVLYTIRGPT